MNLLYVYCLDKLEAQNLTEMNLGYSRHMLPMRRLVLHMSHTALGLMSRLVYALDVHIDETRDS